jgi:steroid 5-alpha reductase family enzyme
MNERLRRSRGLSLLVSGLTYVLALLVAAFVARATGLSHPLALTAAGTVSATVVVFALSVVLDNSSIYDPYWSLQPLALAGYYLWAGRQHLDARLLLVTALIFLYALRLTSNFYRDWPGLAKEDSRYRAFRVRFGRGYWPMSFMGIHLFPTLMVYLGCLPLFGISRPSRSGLGWLDAVGAVVVLAAIGLAFAADEQLRAFRASGDNQGRLMTRGLWARSRHPNYLGEVATWWGLWLFALATGLRWWWTIAGAASITLMFVFASVPMMEKRLLASKAGYREYREAVPMLLPTIGRAAASGDAENTAGGS